MVRGRPRLKCNNCYFGKPGKCEYIYPGGPCTRCRDKGIVCGGIPSRDEPIPPGMVRPAPRPPGRPKKEPSVAAVPVKRGRPSNASRAESVSSGSSKMAVEQQLAGSKPGGATRPAMRLKVANPKTRLPVPDESSDLSAPDDSDEDSELFSSESDDPDDRPFRPSYVPRARGRDAPSTRGSPFVAPAPEVDRTTRSHLANVSAAPRTFFKRGPLPPQPGPLTNKRPRGGNPPEFFRLKGAERDILTEEGSAAEINDLERMGLYLRPPPPDPELIASRSVTVTAAEARKSEKSNRRVLARNRFKDTLQKEVDDQMLPPLPPQNTKRATTWVSLRVPSPRTNGASLTGPPAPLPTDPSVMYHLSQALSWQKQALVPVVLPSILNVFAQHSLPIKARDLENELAKSTAFDQAIETRAKQILVQGLQTLDPQALASAANPPLSPSRLPSSSDRRRSSISSSPQMDKDLKFLSDMAVIHLVSKLLDPLMSAICTACASTGGVILDETAFSQQVHAREDGAIFSAARKEARRQLARNLLAEEDTDEGVQ